jgi:hypothetical protein
VRFDPPRWYAYVFTTVEAHSLHHSVGFKKTRCNYANALILCDRMFGTFREGEAEVVGQDERKRLLILLLGKYSLLAFATQCSTAADALAFLGIAPSKGPWLDCWREGPVSAASGWR